MAFTYIAIYIMAAMIFSVGVFGLIQNYLYNEKVDDVTRYTNFIASDLSINGYLMQNTGIISSIDLEIKNFSKTYGARALVLDNFGRVIHDTSGTKVGKIIASEAVVSALAGKDSSVDHGNFIELTTTIKNYETQEVEGVLLVSVSLEKVIEDAKHIQSIIDYMLSIIGIVLTVIIFFISRIFTKPIQRLLRGIKKISDGHLDQKIVLRTRDEFGQLGSAINKMTSKLIAIDQSRQEFVSNVSHELKTPLSSIKVLTESLLLQDTLPEETYREFLQDINLEVDRQTAIINDLLTLVRLEETEDILNLRHDNINDLVEKILKRLHPLAKKRNIELEMENVRNVEADFDEMKLTLALSNLIENGIKYNKESGAVRVTINEDHENVYIQIRDTGIGIPKEHFNRIYQRFYRVDKTRDRATGGTGLGLSIAHKIILLHKGTIRVESIEDEGTTFFVTIPLRQ